MITISSIISGMWSTYVSLMTTCAISSTYIRQMTVLAQARSKGLVPKASEEILRAFSVSEMKLYKHATTHKYVICHFVDIDMLHI